MVSGSPSPSENESRASSPMPPLKLPPIVTSSLLTKIRSHPQLPPHTWYIISSVTLSALNRPDQIPNIFHSAINQGIRPEVNGTVLNHDEQLRIARRLREGLVKSAAVVGLPKVRTLQHLQSIFDQRLSSIDNQRLANSQICNP